MTFCMELTHKLYSMYRNELRAKKTNQRFGQWFISHYTQVTDIGNLWEETDHNKASFIIRNWLFDNCYHEELPPRIQKWTLLI